MRRVLFTLISFACSLALAATVYRWVDENGVVHYSDQPHGNAEKVHVDSVQTYKAPSGAASAATAGPSAPAPPRVAYKGCVIAQPTDEQTFQNTDSVTIVVRTDPQLQSGDQIYIMIDGQPVNGRSATGPTYTVSPVDRGTHTATATVRTSGGELLCQTPGVTFYVHQPSLLSPINRPPSAVPH